MRRLSLLVAATLVAVSTLLGAAPAGPVSAMPGYEPLPAPQRLVDTRPGESTADGGFAGIGLRGAGSTTFVTVGGRIGLPDDPGTVVLNLTVDQPAGPGFVTVWPCDQARPTASNLNYEAGQTVAVAAVSRVAPDGTVCVYTLAPTHLVIDVAGAFPVGSFGALAAPERLADTREGERTIDGQYAGDGLRPAGDTYRLRVADRGSVPAGATAVALNVTATTVGAPGFLTVFPCDASRPVASNVNYEPGSTTPNLVLTRLDPSGDVCIYTLQPVDLVVDVAGSLGDSVFSPLPEPRRLLDTRAGEATYDGAFRGGGLQQDGATLQLDVAGRAGVPADATAVVLNVTSTGAAAPGFVTAHPQGSPLPGSSNVNFVGGQTRANLVVAGLGPSGAVCLFTRGATHVVADVAGWLTGPAPAANAGSCPARSAPESAATYRNQFVRRPDLHVVRGADRVAVYVCAIPAGSTAFASTERHDETDVDFAAFANAEVAPYFAEASDGAYSVEFVANGVISADVDDGPSQCITEALDRTGPPFTSAFVADSTHAGGGFASPGLIFPGDSGPDVTVFERPPSESRRGGWVGGATISVRPDVGTIVHEVGHTLHWPHSYVGPTDEYDNPVDMMSGGFDDCRSGIWIYPCDPGNTMAFNHLAANWLGNGQVISHPTGTANYVLDRPLASGLQFVAAPGAGDPQSMLTIEGRPAVGNDDFLDTEGVALHVVDQANRSGGLSGLSTARRHRQARGPGDSFEHVLGVGETATVHGVTVTVLRRSGDRYEIRVAGSYTPPAPSFFAEARFSARVACETSVFESGLVESCAM